MTDDNSNPVDMDNLSAFEDMFFEHTAEEPEAEEDVVEEAEEDVEENEDDPLATDDDELDEEADEEDEPDDEPEPEPKPRKRNRTQERIEQLVAEARQAERERDAARRELEQLKTGKEEAPKAETLKDKLPETAPKPDDLNDQGEAKYPLGEFDPQYVTDLSRFTAKQMLKEYKDTQEAEAQQKEVEIAQSALRESWQANLEEAEKELPDIREKISVMAEAFEGINPSYGEYLAGTIMSCEYGPEIMYFLSQNIGEAQKIVASGPAAATLAIGRLEARFENQHRKQEEAKSNKRVSDAPNPPEQRTRGSGGRFAVRPDTDDLAAFERDFFGKS